MRNAKHVDRPTIAQTLPSALEWVWKGYPILLSAYRPIVTPAVERIASLRLLAFLSSRTCRVSTVVCPGVLRMVSPREGGEPVRPCKARPDQWQDRLQATWRGRLLEAARAA